MEEVGPIFGQEWSEGARPVEYRIEHAPWAPNGPSEQGVSILVSRPATTARRPQNARCDLGVHERRLRRRHSSRAVWADLGD